MAKTYEAMSKSEGSLSKSFSDNAAPSGLLIKNSKNTEQMSNLEQQISLFMQNKNARVFHFTSSRETEGVSNIVASAAYFISEKKSAGNVLLIDANFNNPVLHTMFNVPPSPGLRDALSGNGSCSGYIHKTQSGAISIMPCGKGGMNISGGTGREKLSALVSDIKTQYDCILIDAPPLLTSADSLSLAIASDVTFLVTQANRTVWEVAKKSKQCLEKNGCHIGGVILNRFVPVIPEWLYKRL